LCHQLWQEERAQGSRQGKGFRSRLKEAGIKVGRAYRAMRKFFLADFIANPKSKKTKASTSSAVDEVVFRFTGKPHGRSEVLQCTFALTPEKAEFEKCLKISGRLPGATPAARSGKSSGCVQAIGYGQAKLRNRQ
jgi:hypothetical protein